MDEPRTEALGWVASTPVTAPQEDRQYCLLVLGGPQKGASLSLTEGRTTIGRSNKADLPIEGLGISRIHASFEVDQAGSVFFKDEGSTNGIFVNGQRVGEAELKEGDKIGLGPEVIMRLNFPDNEVLSVMEEMYRGATLDPLTSLLNRRSFQDRLEEEFKVNQRHRLPSCVALMDVDKFKSVNDTYGHPAGDAVLVKLAAILQNGLRTGDLLGRWGGEEFIFYMRQTDVDGAINGLNRLRKTLENADIEVPTPDGPQVIRVTMSIGVATCDPLGQLNWAIENADQALYEAKHQGRNRVIAK